MLNVLTKRLTRWGCLFAVLAMGFAFGSSTVFAQPTGQNSPGVSGPENIVVDLDPNMIPIYWDGNPNGDTSGTWKTTSTSNLNNQWYDYQKKYWANAVTVTPASLSTYHNTTNVTVQESDVLGYWVYIPRYRYQIQRYSALGDQPLEKPTAFNIKFENKSTGGYEKAVPEQNNDWATHPAFTFGDEDNPNPTELNGLWIAKFETTGTAANPTVKPNLTTLVNQ
ncbi:MAG: hypothetical protein LBL08_02850, partial [Candidatus Nomurabacteria bacterium]|nr:hypothetical protein [Candidatus Nomurabacteria bacterium]